MDRQTLTVKTTFNHQMTLFEGEHITQKILKRGIYEKELLTYVNALLAQLSDAVVFDVGANVGNHTLVFSINAKQVYAFEPVPEVYEILSTNLQQNAITNVKPMQLALSDENGDSTFYISTDGNIGQSGFDMPRTEAEPVTVSKRVGDDLFRELDLPKLDLIKVDVEGHELSVLRGLRETILKYKPYIIMEWNESMSEEQINDCDILNDLFANYDVSMLGNNYDKGYWQGKPLARVRRKLTRWLLPKRSATYAFDAGLFNQNILFIPRAR